MSQKMKCPGCESYTSATQRAYDYGEPCPHCGLPASTTEQVLAARRKSADAELTARYEEIALRLGRAEAEADRYRYTIEKIRDILAELDRA